MLSYILVYLFYWPVSCLGGQADHIWLCFPYDWLRPCSRPRLVIVEYYKGAGSRLGHSQKKLYLPHKLSNVLFISFKTYIVVKIYWLYIMFKCTLCAMYINTVYMLFIIIYYHCIFPLSFIPLKPSSTSTHPPLSLQSPHYCPCPWVLFFFTCSPPCPQTTPPELSACSLFVSLSLFCLLVQFVH